MRKATKIKCRKSSRYPRGEKYAGAVEYRGHQKWVGTFPSLTAWKDAARIAEKAMMAEVDGGRESHTPTVGQFAGLTTTDAGRVVRLGDVAENWPWTHRRGICKDSTARRYEEALRPFIRRYEHRVIDSFSRQEARVIAASVGTHTSQALRRFFADALDDELITGRNPFGGLGRRTTRRLDDPAFEVATDELFDQFKAAALKSRTDAYRYVQHAIVLLEGTTAMRPSEIFAVEWDRLLMEERTISLVQQVDDRGHLTLPKNGRSRQVPLSDEVVAAIRAMPRLSPRWVFPTPRGGLMRNCQWNPHWKAIRALAGRPDFEFYELKHRAITWMVTPPPHGLGLSPVDVAEIVGHTDGGATIAKYYLKLAQKQVVERAQAAMTAWFGGRHLRAVGSQGGDAQACPAPGDSSSDDLPTTQAGSP
jgi:integrase